MNIQSNSEYISRRSPVLSKGNAAASSQVPATQAGIEIFNNGGTAADAAIAIAAALQVTQPCSTGLGGDCFFLYYDNNDKRVTGLNGSGRSPRSLSLEKLFQKGYSGRIPDFDSNTVTVPGAAAAWNDLLSVYGSLPLSKVLAPAIDLAENGFPVSPLTSFWWGAGADRQLKMHKNGHELMIDGRGPYPGEIIRLPELADTLRRFAEEGPSCFYNGIIGERIVTAVKEAGGSLEMQDMTDHRSEWVSPISTGYRGYDVWECPPNGQGLAALIALNLASGFDPAGLNDADRYHILIECMRLGFADSLWYVADPDDTPVPVEQLLSDDYAAMRRQNISLSNRLSDPLSRGKIEYTAGNDTVYFSVVDAAGNGCSFINSNYMGFGTGIVPEGCGFSLQNRGAGFVLEPGHPNCYAPGKRPYHTIIPGMITESGTGDLRAVFGVMGGMMQPQGHLQVVSNLIDLKLDPQNSLDRGRFQIEGGNPGNKILLESSIKQNVIDALSSFGHEISVIQGRHRSAFGLGQVIWIDDNKVRWCGSDPRGDGCALGC